MCERADDGWYAVTWEDTKLQADLTMGNLASALTLQSEEAALVEELRAGSEEAFAWLITRYHQPIYSLLARTVRNSADAADLTQEVFVKVFRGIHGFHGESSLRTWIYRIALREASNQRRWWMRHQQQEIAMEQEMTHGRLRTPGATEGHAGRSWLSRLTTRPCTRKIGRGWSRRCARCLSHFAPR